MIRLTFDPIKEVLAAIETLYPDFDCTIDWVLVEEDGAPFGQCAFDEMDNLAAVEINAATPVGAVPEIIGHEVAHAIAGADADHGPEWEAVFDRIYAEYVRRVTEQQERDGGSLAQLPPSSGGIKA